MFSDQSKKINIVFTFKENYLAIVSAIINMIKVASLQWNPSLSHNWMFIRIISESSEISDP
jgi:hypothetical protein